MFGQDIMVKWKKSWEGTQDRTNAEFCLQPSASQVQDLGKVHIWIQTAQLVCVNMAAEGHTIQTPQKCQKFTLKRKVHHPGMTPTGHTESAMMAFTATGS